MPALDMVAKMLDPASNAGGEGVSLPPGAFQLSSVADRHHGAPSDARSRPVRGSAQTRQLPFRSLGRSAEIAVTTWREPARHQPLNEGFNE